MVSNILLPTVLKQIRPCRRAWCSLVTRLGWGRGEGGKIIFLPRVRRLSADCRMAVSAGGAAAGLPASPISPSLVNLVQISFSRTKEAWPGPITTAAIAAAVMSLPPQLPPRPRHRPSFGGLVLSGRRRSPALPLLIESSVTSTYLNPDLHLHYAAASCLPQYTIQTTQESKVWKGFKAFKIKTLW